MASVAPRSSVGSTLPSVKYPILLQLIQEIAEGKTPRQACQDVGVSVAAFRYHIGKDDELQALFKDALDVGNDALAEMLVDIDKTHSNPAMAAVISKNIQWLLERRNPGKFGARVQVSMENNATKELIAALDKAIDRIPVANVPRVPMITDASFEVVEPKKKGAFVAPPSPADPLEELKALGLV